MDFSTVGWWWIRAIMSYARCMPACREVRLMFRLCLHYASLTDVYPTLAYGTAHRACMAEVARSSVNRLRHPQLHVLPLILRHSGRPAPFCNPWRVTNGREGSLLGRESSLTGHDQWKIGAKWLPRGQPMWPRFSDHIPNFHRSSLSPTSNFKARYQVSPLKVMV